MMIVCIDLHAQKRIVYVQAEPIQDSTVTVHSDCPSLTQAQFTQVCKNDSVITAKRLIGKEYISYGMQYQLMYQADMQYKVGNKLTCKTISTVETYFSWHLVFSTLSTILFFAAFAFKKDSASIKIYQLRGLAGISQLISTCFIVIQVGKMSIYDTGISAVIILAGVFATAVTIVSFYEDNGTNIQRKYVYVVYCLCMVVYFISSYFIM